MSEPPEPTDSAELKPRTLDQAIDECEKHVRRHSMQSWATIVVLLAFGYVLHLAFQWTDSALTKAINAGRGAMDEERISHLAAILQYMPYLFVAAFLVVFGVMIAIYRFHLVEITKNEQYKLGFWRIRIAANNTTEGFQTEVRRALTENAFSFEKSRSGFKRSKDLESPLPGHPASDLVTAVLNKLLDEVEFSPSKKLPDK